MKKVVINIDYGGYSISNKAWKAIQDAHEPSEIQGDECRTSPALIDFIHKYGFKAASGHYSNLAFALIPDDATDWRIEEYDGMETVWYVQNGKMYNAPIDNEDRENDDD